MAKSKNKNKVKAKPPRSKITSKIHNMSQPGHTFGDLRTYKELWYKLLLLIYDFHNLKTSPASVNRLNQTVDPLYISYPYFTFEEAWLVTHALVGDEESEVSDQLHLYLAFFLEKRRASGDARPCGPHDLGPLFLRVFGIEKSEIEEEKFVSRVKRSGLGDGQNGTKA